MAKEVASARPTGSAPLFNSTLETGVRSVVILDALHPRAFDLAHLTWFDHLVVHTSDIGGPGSLHPFRSEQGNFSFAAGLWKTG